MKKYTSNGQEGDIWARAQQTIVRRRTQLSGALAHRFEHLSPSGKKWLLGLFTLLCFAVSAFVGIGSLVRPAAPIHVDPIRMPILPEAAQKQNVLSQEEYNRLHRYRMRLDSLIAGGDTTFRPTRDTLRYLESIYTHH